MNFDFSSADWSQWRLHGECVDWNQPWTLVKSNAVRNVYALGNPVHYYIKIEETVSCFSKIRALFASKAKAEFKTGTRLAERNIPVVEYTAWGLNGRYQMVASRAFAEGISAHRYLYQEIVYAHKDGNDFIEDLKKFLVRFAKGRCNHPDLHLGNILYNAKTREMRLVDVYGVKPVRQLRARERFQIAHVVTELSPLLKTNEQQRFLQSIELPDALELPERIRTYEKNRIEHDMERRLRQLRAGYDKFATASPAPNGTIYRFSNRLRQPKVKMEELPPRSEWRKYSEAETRQALISVVSGLISMAEVESPLLAWDGENRFYTSMHPPN